MAKEVTVKPTPKPTAKPHPKTPPGGKTPREITLTDRLVAQESTIRSLMDMNMVLAGIVRSDVPTTVAQTMAALVASQKIPEASHSKLPTLAKLAWNAHDAVNAFLPTTPVNRAGGVTDASPEKK